MLAPPFLPAHEVHFKTRQVYGDGAEVKFSSEPFKAWLTKMVSKGWLLMWLSCDFGT